MLSIKMTNKADDKSMSFAISEGCHPDQIDSSLQAGLLLFAGNLGSGKHTLAQATFEMFDTERALYGELSNEAQALECLDDSLIKLCFATIHVESEEEVLDALSKLGLLEHVSQIKAIFYCLRDNECLKSRKLEFNFETAELS